MNVTLFPCGTAANQSELTAFQLLKAAYKLKSARTQGYCLRISRFPLRTTAD